VGVIGSLFQPKKSLASGWWKKTDTVPAARQAIVGILGLKKKKLNHDKKKICKKKEEKRRKDQGNLDVKSALSYERKHPGQADESQTVPC